MVYRLEIPDGRFQEFLKMVENMRMSGLVNSCKVVEDEESDFLKKFVGKDASYTNEDLVKLVNTAEDEFNSGDYYTTEDIIKLLAE